MLTSGTYTHVYFCLICSCKEGSGSIFQKTNELWPADERAEPLPDLAKLSVCGPGEAKEVSQQ